MSDADVNMIQEREAMSSVSDLAQGATSEDDARTWAQDLGLEGRIPKARFVKMAPPWGHEP